MTLGPNPGGNRPVGTQQPGVVPERPASTTLASYPRYVEAQRLVDYLSDNGFDVSGVRIIGRGLHSVEQVLTRMTKGRAAAMGAASGAWFGLLIGFLLSLFTPAPIWQPLLLAIVLGALWGALLGFLSQSATRGQRDFASTSRLEADVYDVEVDADKAAEAADIAGRLKIRDGQS
ncbi:YflT domain-containing protein [Epidermidibacterium keratini]|uniref:general stress protein n=1 Tax=Epidermidibacterium keratini TaxID=1891644 RepID=UPI0018659A6C|nr:general stress protein [Epidermidibacterium keratini]